jgi:mono/diheme cytochrome c family protein
MFNRWITTMRLFPALLLLLAAGVGHAATPQQIGQAYAAEAATSQPAFTPSAKRGEALFRQRFAINDKMPTCASCHTDNPLVTGQHVVTGKTVRPLAVAANGERFSDPAKVEKWFGRNCKEVIGRACTPAEKADFVAYMGEAR